MSTGSEAAAATPAPTPAPAAPKMDKKAAAEARAALSAEVADMQRQLLEKTRELSALTATSGKRSSKGKAVPSKGFIKTSTCSCSAFSCTRRRDKHYVLWRDM